MEVERLHRECYIVYELNADMFWKSSQSRLGKTPQEPLESQEK